MKLSTIGVLISAMQEAHSITLRIGAVSGAAVAGLSALYVVVLVVGLLTLPTPDAQIADPWFTVMELLILLISPAMVVFAIALQAWAPAERRALGSIAVVFLGICAAVTMVVHLVVLVASRTAPLNDLAMMRSLFSFQWPSIAYVLDIFAWDVAFPIGSLAAAAAIPRSAHVPAVRILLLCSSILAFVGLMGVPLSDMRLRNIGILGYAVLFPAAAGIMSTAFLRESRGRRLIRI